MLTDLTNHSMDLIKRVDDRNGGYGGGPANQSIYATDFEPNLLAESREFYKNEGDLLLNSCDASEYLKKVCKSLPFRLIIQTSPICHSPLTLDLSPR